MAYIITRRNLLAASTAGLATLALPGRAFAQRLTGFTHGVASGDPHQTRVVLWTRYVSPGLTRLRVEVAEDESFTRPVTSGEVEVSPAHDHCIRAIVDNLPPDRWLHYRFVAPNGETSDTGRTRTLPDGDTASFRVAVFSCSNGTSGWFNAYAHAAARDDIDLAIHTGDYIYESPLTRPDAQPGMATLRNLAPPGEIVQLADYRQRYASYRADPDLAELHRRLPMIAVQDDHESANNSWRDGASAHDSATEGEWAARKAIGQRVWREWMPAHSDWYGSHRIGKLATLFRLETRLLGRTRQIDGELDAIFAAGGDVEGALSALREGALADPARAMMNIEQERWLADGLNASVDTGVRWQVLVQQVILGAIRAPTPAASWIKGGIPADMQPDVDRRARLNAAGMPYSLDKWDGYPAARQRLYDASRRAGANLVTFTGDSHNAWAFDLADQAGPVGVEFAGQSVSSYGFERRYNGDAARVAADFMAANPNLKWMDASQRGYFTLDIHPDRIDAEYVFVPAVGGRSAVATGKKVFVAEHGARRLSA
jgi:alkaline phosphatase D